MTSQALVESVDPAPVASPATSWPTPPSSVRVRVPIASEADIAIAGEHGRRLASRLDFVPSDVTVIVAAIAEVARNVLSHGAKGDLLLHLIQKRGRLGVSIVARDRGPGIADVSGALRDGASTAGGLGLGLASARRLMDEFQLRSEVGRGTTVSMRKWARSRHEERARTRSVRSTGLRVVK